MVPGTYNILARQGSVLRLTFALLDELGVAVNLTGCTPKMQVRVTASSTTVALDCLALLSVPTPANGQIVLVVPGASLAGLAAGQYVYDLDVQMSDLSVDTWLAGVCTVQAQVTR
jgi:hypothetical protein